MRQWLVWPPVADDLRVELCGPYLTVSGVRKGPAMGMRSPGAAGGGKGVVLRRELDHGFFSATWKLPVGLYLDISRPIYLLHDPRREGNVCSLWRGTLLVQNLLDAGFSAGHLNLS
jgi:hypothetical protein